MRAIRQLIKRLSSRMRERWECGKFENGDLVVLDRKPGKCYFNPERGSYPICEGDLFISGGYFSRDKKHFWAKKINGDHWNGMKSKYFRKAKPNNRKTKKDAL